MPDAIHTPGVQPWDITPEQEQAFRATDATFDWLCKQPAEFFRQFAGQWIAARDCRVIASADTMDALLAHLEGADLRTLIIHRVEKPGVVIYR